MRDQVGSPADRASSEAPVSVAIASSQRLVGEALAALIADSGGIAQVVGSATDQAGIDRVLSASRPRILVLSEENEREAEKAITRIRERHPETGVVVCVAMATAATVARAHRAGAASVIELTSDADALIAAIRSVAEGAGRALVSRSLMFRPDRDPPGARYESRRLVDQRQLAVSAA